jgi:hypothetical protein
VRYEVTEPLVVAAYCHCTRCRRRSGTAAGASARTAPGSFRVTRGEELIRCWQPEDGYAKCFCNVCGGGLWSRREGEDSVWVRLGGIDGDPGIRPSYRQDVAFAAVWEPIPDDGIPHYEGEAP